MSRRAFGSVVTAAAFAGDSKKNGVLAADWSKYPDPATEFQVLRLTAPEYTSFLPSPPRRSISRKGDFLIILSDREGSPKAFRIDQKSGDWRDGIDVHSLDPELVSLMPDDRTLCIGDGDALKLVRLEGGRERVAYQCTEGWKRDGGIALTDDGMYAMLVEARAGIFRLRLIPLGKGNPSTLVESSVPIGDLQPRPRRAAISYRKHGDPSLWLVDFAAMQNYRLQLDGQGISTDTEWSADGRSIYYLQLPAERGKLITLREFNPDAHTDAVIAPTTQFASFSRNTDGTVFVGASGSKASPHVLLLLRATKRELTLCEHKASKPLNVTPIFNPSSERVYFQSDRDGKPCIYSMAVDKLVEKTDT